MPSDPYAHLHQDADDSDADRSTPAATDGAIDPEAEMRARISAELQQEVMMQRFREEHPDLWMQVNRLGRLMSLQEDCEGGEFPPGSCFLYAAVPGFHCFAVRKVLGVDLDTCQVSLDIHSDGELEEGTVMLPLEAVSWYGFPKHAIPLAFPYSGFSTSRPLEGLVEPALESAE
ncbi:MAG: hypothetical protein EA402_04935 [Planctomycetota bacterium]|nr:MAG: hypothetical protein EA402_04935 [Planctomycetota bacterium]